MNKDERIMKHLLRNVAIGLVAVGTLVFFHSPGAYAAVREERPRIWLTPEFKTTLIARLGRNTESGIVLRTWCDTHMGEDLSTYITDRAGEMGRAINYALMYQLTGNTAYANRAVEIIEYAFANPYAGYTIDTWIEFNSFYTSRYLVPPVAIVLDWCFDAMTPTQRTTFAAQLDRWANRIMTADQWAWHDPSNNFYYGYMWALLSSGYALYGLNANAQQYIDYARDTMLDQAIKFTKNEQIIWERYGTTVGRAKGGMWNEGTHYGNHDYGFLCSSVQAVTSAEGRAYPDFTFPDEAIKFLIYSKHPSGSGMYSDGDGAKGSYADEYTRLPALFLISLATGDTQRFGRYWVDTYVPPGYWETYKYYNEFIWYDDQLAGLDYRGAIPDYYYVEGTKTLFWRSSWNQDATWLSMKLGVLNTDHAHNGLGDLTIFKSGFLATDKAAETRDGMLTSDIHHSVLYIPPAQEMKLWWGESSLRQFESTSNYLYLAGDLSGPYLAQPVKYPSNNVAHKDREILIVKPENVIAVMDRGSSYDAVNDKTFQIYLHNQAVRSGTDYRSSNGNSDLVIHPAYPAAPIVTLDTYGIPRVQISTAEAQISKSFLTILKVTDPAGAFQAPQATTSAGDIAVAAFYGTADPVDYLIAFSTDPNANPSSASSFTLNFERSHSAVRAYLANLAPNTAFYLSGDVNGAAATVTVSRTPSTGATAFQSDAHGFLFCEMNLGEAEQPPDPPIRVGID
jgi:hypothetical protein